MDILVNQEEVDGTTRAGQMQNLHAGRQRRWPCVDKPTSRGVTYTGERKKRRGLLAPKREEARVQIDQEVMCTLVQMVRHVWQKENVWVPLQARRAHSFPHHWRRRKTTTPRYKSSRGYNVNYRSRDTSPSSTPQWKGCDPALLSKQLGYQWFARLGSIGGKKLKKTGKEQEIIHRFFSWDWELYMV